MTAVLRFALALISGRDNQTPDAGRIGWILGGTVFLALSIVNYKAFDPISFGTGFGALFAGAGIGVGAKARTEPQQ